VVEYKEANLDQRPIDEETFYWRYTYNPSTQRVLPGGKLKETCLCKQPYIPDDNDIMHFCPTCRKSYHETCLINDDWVEKTQLQSGKLPRATQFERSLDFESSEYAALPALKRSRNPQNSKLSRLEKIYSDLPYDLLKLAKSPIVRGGFEHGVSGNVFPVMRARSFVYDALMENEPLPDNWREEVLTKLSKVGAWVAGDENFLCPGCQGVI